MSTPNPQTLTSLPPLLVGTSTKMYFSHARTLSYLQSLLSLPSPPSHLSLFYIPTFPSLAPCATAIQTSTSSPKPLLGAQDCHWEASGAHTGSVSPALLHELGCTLVELGHAERRRPPLSETDDLVARKAQAAVQAGLVPLVCVGEVSKAPEGASLEQGHETALKEVGAQVKSVLEAVDGSACVVFAYEPVWAIGAKEPADPGHVRGVVAGIKGLVEGRKGDVRVLYGGSAGPGTWKGLKGAVDGLFLGRFAHDVDNLWRTVGEVGAA